MSSYHPPTHNRLLDLEHHLRGRRPGIVSARQHSIGLSTQGRPSNRASVQGRPAPRLQRQPAQKPQFSGEQPLSPLSEQPSLRQPTQSSPQPSVTLGGAASKRAGQNPRPMNLGEMSLGERSDSYRQLAAQLGRYTWLNPAARSPKTDLPAIPTPISPEIVETFSASPLPATPHKQKRRAIAPPIAPPAPPLSSSPPQSNWKALAMTIRQARLGYSHTQPEAIAQAAAVQTQPPEKEWAIDDIFTKAIDPEDSDPVNGNRDEVAIPVEAASLECDALSSSQTQDETLSQAVCVEVMSPDADIVIDIPNTPVTVDVHPIAPSAGELNAKAMESQAEVTAISLEEQEKVNPQHLSSEVCSKDSQPPAMTLTPVILRSELATKALMQDLASDIDPISKLDGAAPIPSANSGSDIAGLKNGLLLLTYQLACPPQIIQYLAHLRRPKHQRKQPLPTGLGQRKSHPPQLNAS